MRRSKDFSQARAASRTRRPAAVRLKDDGTGSMWSRFRIAFDGGDGRIATLTCPAPLLCRPPETLHDHEHVWSSC